MTDEADTAVRLPVGCAASLRFPVAVTWLGVFLGAMNAGAREAAVRRLVAFCRRIGRTGMACLSLLSARAGDALPPASFGAGSPVDQLARGWEEKFVLRNYEPADPLAKSLHDYFKKLFAAAAVVATDERRDIARVLGTARQELAADTERMVEAFVAAGYKRSDAEAYFDRLYPRLQADIARALVREDSNRSNTVKREDSSVADGLILKAGELRYESKDYVGALKALEDALRFAPSNVRLTLDRALTLQKIGRFNEAREDFDLARELYPNVVNIYVGLGDVRVAARDYYGAIEALNTAIYLQPAAMRAYAIRGHARLGLEDYEGAIDDYGMQVASGGGFGLEGVLGRRAQAHLALGNAELALRDAEAAVQLNPQYVPAHAMLGTIQRRLGRPGAALVALNQALELRPDHAPSLNARAWVRFDLGQEQAAMDDMDRFIALDAGNPFRRYLRAGLLELSGQLDAAERECRETIALALASRDTASWYYANFQLDLLLRRQGRTDMAYLKDVLDWPDDWAKRVAMHLAGRITADSLLQASRHAPTKSQRKIQECEANYYAGMLLLIAGRREEAVVYLKAAADPAYEGNVEHTYAERRLREVTTGARRQ